MKFWSVPEEWLDFKKQAKATISKEKSEKEVETATKVSEQSLATKQNEPEKIEPVTEKPKPKKKKLQADTTTLQADTTTLQNQVDNAIEEPQKEQPLEKKKQNEKANLFDSDGEEVIELLESSLNSILLSLTININ